MIQSADRRLIVRLLTLLVLVLSSATWGWLEFGADNTPYFSAAFLAVGQGDAILLRTPSGVDVLIDGGPDGAVLRELARALPWGNRQLDLVISTHPDKDHIGGLVDVLSQYQVKQILTTENRGETNVATAYQTALLAEPATITYALAGQVYQLDASTTLAILSPANDPSMLESNTASIVVKVTYGEIDFLLTGDAPKSIEDFLAVAYGPVLQSEVLKLGHHGSDTSTSDLFLDTVQPQYAVVSAGRDNRYGHPHATVVNKVTAAGITLKNTADAGTVTFLTDGTKVWVK